jgi:predicted nucleotidyltransferase
MLRPFSIPHRMNFDISSYKCYKLFRFPLSGEVTMFEDVYAQANESFELGLDPLATRKMAEAVGRTLASHPLVHEVLLFGSVARTGIGNDLDLLLITDAEHASLFVEKVEEGLSLMKQIHGSSRVQPAEQVYVLKLLRLLAACDTFDSLEEHDDLFSQKLQSAKFEAPDVLFDIFVYQDDWRDRLAELQELLPHGDAQFMNNIARDAIKIA